MKKSVLDAVLVKMEQAGNLKRIEQVKKENQNAFELDGIRYKRSDLYPMILNILNPVSEYDSSVLSWTGQNRVHIETGEREVPAED